MPFDSWGTSWTPSWGQSWVHPDVAVPPTVIPSGGYPYRGPYKPQHPWLRELKPEVQEVIQQVAEEQLEDLQLPKRLQALRLKRELKAKAIEYHTKYFEALALEREFLIEVEIAERLKARFDDEEAVLILALMAI